ncbi:DUF300-domain-containing protein [Phlegmacium glaucopus]|nr:DUF300-domain-containing protein [Phlegmacium glaucopus]
MSSNSNSSCPTEIAQNLPPLFQNGHIVLQTYHVGWIISGSFALVSILTSFWLIKKHLQWYTNKREQRYIIRILFLVPIYALISFASFLFWNHATPLLLIRDAYEAIVLTSFFYLLLTYLSHDPEEQKMIFLKSGLSLEADQIARQKGDEIKHWLFPLKFVTWKPRDGLYFLQMMKWGVLQYCVIRPTTTLAAVILNYMGLYCENSWGLGWGHIYISAIVALSVTVAMYCLIQIYVSVSKNLVAHKPLLKLFAIKAVVFLTFWQSTFLSALSWIGVIKATKYMSTNDVIIAISAILETVEMALFAFLHIKAFTYKCYQLHLSSSSKSLPPLRTAQWRSLGHAMDFRETFREIWIGSVYLVEKVKGKEPTQDFGTKRTAHYEQAFGRQRPLQGKEYTNANYQERTPHPVKIEVDQRVEVMIEGRRQWLGIGRYGRYAWDRRERSTALGEQIDQELERRGYPKRIGLNDPKNVDLQPGGQRSWWRNLYDRLSQTAPEAEDDICTIWTLHTLPKLYLIPLLADLMGWQAQEARKT